MVDWAGRGAQFWPDAEAIGGAMKANRPVTDLAGARGRLQSAGLRCTAARLTVLRRLMQAQHPLSHAELAAALADDGFDRVTVYRNLVELADAGLATRVELGDHVWRFELRPAGSKSAGQHPHFVCTECGKVECLADVDISFKPQRGRARPARKRPSGTITAVLLKGRCANCA